jgi:aquaporin Z
MRQRLVEGLGTFFLVLVIGLAVMEPGAGPLAPLAIGAALMVMVYAGGHVSGAHYNPAVTVAVWLRGKCALTDALGYVVAQMIGAVLAAWVATYCKAGNLVEAMRPDLARAFVVELLFTFALAFVVLNVATSKKTAGNSYFGLAIGFTVMAGAFAAGNISGGVFNPAVAVGLIAMGLSMPEHLWVYLAAQLAGGVLAAWAFRTVTGEKS